MYYRYFGLKEEPFSIAVNPRYLFMSARHRDALAHLLYGVGAGGGFILLTGEVGTGKTTINRCLLEQLPDNTDIAIILNPALNADELLATACDEFGIEYERGATLKDLTDRLHAFLLENHRQDRNTVLLIDEAQHLQFEVLEQIRLLTNLETNTRKLLQIILVGQPELTAMLAKPELRQLSQRITARYNLQPLNLDETDAYIRHRLQVAGLPANQELFPARVVKEIFRATRGIPRLINVVCDRVLLGSYGQNESRVSMKMLRQALREVMGDEPVRNGGAWRWALAAAALLLVAAFPAWYFYSESLTTDAPQVAASAPAVQPTPSVAPAAIPGVVNNRESALRELADHLGLSPAPGSVCPTLGESGWRCEALEAGSWEELLEFNRPAVLTLLSPARFVAYAVLVSVEGEYGLLRNDAGVQRVPLSVIGPQWRGDFELIWQPPGAYAGPVGLGDSGPMVAWLAQAFARLDGQSQPLAGEEFNAALEARVRLFQRQFNLQDDGVVGLKTLLKLNAVRGESPPLQRSSGLAQLGDN
ncbi:MAG: AAA family ATPase [Halieaceae bacterium]|jgi:general secretion pathway protein A|nr:AAA family ATPase [Halieaceae bacterium]